MKYSEANDRKVFDWKLFLNKEKPYSTHELFNASLIAGDWHTCPMGQQSNLIPRVESGFWKGAPLDGWLKRDGYAFHNQIKKMYHAKDETYYDKYRLKAIELVKRIEDRSSLVIKRLSN